MLSPGRSQSVNQYRLPVHDMLLWRRATVPTPPLGACYGTEVISNPVEQTSPPCAQTGEFRSNRRLEGAENSWLAQRRAWQVKDVDACDEGFGGNIQIAQKFKSILNSLIVDNFDKLYLKLTEYKIATPTHLQISMSDNFDKATMQHHFIHMHADLCSRLHDFFSGRVMPDKLQTGFKRLLLRQGQTAFEQNLVPPTVHTQLDQKERILAEVCYKTQMIGTVAAPSKIHP